jgi:DHA1 family solute carrier family 18 vesicular amine transporter 1/2
MVIGFSIMVISTLAFAFGSNYPFLLFARAFQGIGSSCVGVSGMAALAQSYPEDNERGKVMGIALSGGLAGGVLIGPPFGGFMSEFVGKSSPFLVLAMLSFIGVILQLFIIYPKIKQTRKEAACSMNLIQDPYILIVTGSLMLSNMAVAMLESSLPIMMMDRMGVDLWQIGAIFLPCTLSYMVGTCLFGRIGSRIGRWLTSLLGLYLLGGAFVFVIFTYKPEFLIAPMAFTGFGIGMVSSSMFPELGHLADFHQTENYGSVYAMGDMAVCLGFAIGPALSGGLAKLIGFKWMAIVTSLLCFAHGPLLFIIKSPPKLDPTKKKS